MPARFNWLADTKQHDQSARAMPKYNSFFLALGSPNPSYTAYSVRPLHMHGATDYGGYHLGGLKMLAVRSGKVVRAIPWRPWAAKSRRGGIARNSWPGLAAQVARGPPQRQDGRERRGAPYVTHSVFWRTGAQNVRENVT